MRRTLFLIPHELASIPVFGVGWVLGILIVAFSVRLAWAKYRSDRVANSGDAAAPTVTDVLSAEGPFWGLVVAAVVFVLPGIEIRNVDGEPIGMAIRGYGAMLVVAMTSAVMLAAYRVRRMGMDPDWVYSLAPLLLVCGIVGARSFFVIQYFDHFRAPTLGETLRNVFAFTEGGMVVYGSLIGGFLAFWAFAAYKKIPMLRFGDALIPSILLGIFLGRIGCLMNGCCYGGRCEDGWASIRFPKTTAVYNEQLRSGELLGMGIDFETGEIREVRDGSIAERLGIRPGDEYQSGTPDERTYDAADSATPLENIQPGWVMRVSDRTHVVPTEELPDRALPVRATQPLSSATALALCLLLCFASRYIRRDGALLALGFGGYAVVRFGLEMVRVDEAGQFNTSLTISQWVSIAVLILAILALLWLYRPLKATRPIAEQAVGENTGG